MKPLGAIRTSRCAFGERKRAQQNGVDDGKDDDIGADAESEDEDGDDGECAYRDGGCGAEAEILKRTSSQGKPRAPRCCSRLLDAAEVDQGATAGFFRRHALLDVLFDGEFEMGRDFDFKVRIQVWFVEEGEYPGEILAERSRRFPPSEVPARTRATIPERRRQYAASAASCLRPRRVME